MTANAIAPAQPLRPAGDRARVPFPRSHPNDRHDTYSFLLDVSDFLRSLDGMSDWSDRITAIADENFDPSVDGDK